METPTTTQGGTQTSQKTEQPSRWENVIVHHAQHERRHDSAKDREQWQKDLLISSGGFSGTAPPTPLVLARKSPQRIPNTSVGTPKTKLRPRLSKEPAPKTTPSKTGRENGPAGRNRLASLGKAARKSARKGALLELPEALHSRSKRPRGIAGNKSLLLPGIKVIPERPQEN